MPVKRIGDPLLCLDGSGPIAAVCGQALPPRWHLSLLRTEILWISHLPTV